MRATSGCFSSGPRTIQNLYEVAVRTRLLDRLKDFDTRLGIALGKPIADENDTARALNGIASDLPKQPDLAEAVSNTDLVRPWNRKDNFLAGFGHGKEALSRIRPNLSIRGDPVHATVQLENRRAVEITCFAYLSSGISVGYDDLVVIRHFVMGHFGFAFFLQQFEHAVVVEGYDRVLPAETRRP